MALLDLPKYAQVKQAIAREIEGDRYAVGSAFPSESQLLKRFEVSRPTLIRALQELVRDGYLDRQQGRGTFVSARWRNREEATTVLPVFLSNSVANQVGDARSVQMQIFEGIQTALSERQPQDGGAAYSMVLHQLASDRLDEAATRFIESLSPGVALIVEPSFNAPLWSFLLERGWSPWGLNEPVDGGQCVFIDQERAGYLATRYLIEENRQHIALLNGPREAYWGFPARERGYCRAMDEAGLAIDPTLMLEAEHALDSEAGRSMFGRIVDAKVPCDGIVGATDLKAMGAMAAAMEAGRDVPRDVMFVGIDNTAAFRSDPPMSSVDLPFMEVGRQAIQQAFAAQCGSSPSTPLQVCLQPVMFERDAKHV
ncbi:MAG: GntR family transcriptional regulator [Planctomycetota bacterium]